MTPRSLIFGLGCAALLSAVVYFNDFVLRQTFLIGNHLPISVYGALILFVALANPLLRRLRSGAAFTGKELTVVFVLAVTVCAIPSSGLLRYFTVKLMIPHHHEKTEPGWSENNLVDLVPEKMLADSEGLTDWQRGLSQGAERMPFGDIPWEHWTQTFSFWLPLIVAIWMALLGLSLMFHVQWARHEHLPYPLARFTHEILPEPGQPRNPIFRNKFFIAATLGVMTIHLLNFAKVYFPDMIGVKLDIELYPVLKDVHWRFKAAADLHHFFNFKIYFIGVGIAFFLAREVSFSIGVSTLLYGLMAGSLAMYGIDLKGGGIFAPRDYMATGAYVGLFATLLYTGRHFYRQTLLNALWLTKPAKEMPAYAVWGLRLFFLSSLTAFSYLVSTGLDWQLALIFLALLIVMFVVMGRILAETGIIIIQAAWRPAAIMVGFFGAQSLGPETYAILALLSIVLLYDPRESLMPYLVNGFRMLEHRGVQVGKVAAWCAFALVMGLAIALPITLYWQYEGGIANHNPHARTWPSKIPFNQTLQIKERLIAQGSLEKAMETSGWERLQEMSMQPASVTAFIAAVLLVLGFSWARLRFSWWPLHPVIFAIWIAWGTRWIAPSFLIGWIVKSVVVKYGGEKAVNRVKPFMVGLICGEILGAIVPIIINMIYYQVTGRIPERFIVLPS